MNKNKNFNARPSQKEMKEVESLYESNQLELLETKLRKLIENYPKTSILFNILGITLQKKGFFQDAIGFFKQATEIQPNFDHAYNNMGNVFKLMGKYEEAVISYQKAIKINSRYAEAYSNLGNVFKELGKINDSILNHRLAIKINPNYAEAYSNLGNTLSELAKFEEAADNHRLAIKINPYYPEGYSNLGNALGELGKLDEAVDNYRKALKLNPEYKESILNESLIRLTQGKFEIGWKGYEFRFYKSAVTLMRYKIDKLWDGNYLNGTLLVWGEQGIGDHIIFASMLTDLKKYAKNIILEIDRRLVNLFKSYFYKINFLNIKVIGLEKKSVISFDKHIAIGSLGQYLRKTKKSFETTPKKYLIPSHLNEKKFKKKLLDNKKIKIGLSWKTLNKKQQFRNIDLEEMLPILSNPNCDFINLQFGKTEEDLQHIKSKHRINIKTISEIDNYNNIESLAALINCLDLVITIQNTTAHLAGALGKKTWIMLTKNARWHWTINEKKSLWYPSAKLFKQDKLGDWNTVINSISMHLKNYKVIKN